MRRLTTVIFGALVASSLWYAFPMRAAVAQQPNIVLIFSDDAGYNEFGFNTTRTGSSSNFLTPNLDSLAAQSAVMSNGCKRRLPRGTASCSRPITAGCRIPWPWDTWLGKHAA